MKNILITGVNGFVGTNLVYYLKSNLPDIKIIGVDNLISSDVNELMADEIDYFIPLSASDVKIKEYIEKFEVDTIFHLAAFSANINSIYKPLDDLQNSLLSTINLLECVKDNKKIKRFVYSSAGCSLGTTNEFGEKFITEKEEVSLKLDTPYQITKIAGEQYCNFYHKQYNVPIVRARFQNVYGPGELLGAGIWRGTEASIWRNVTPIFIYKALKNEPLTITGTGEESRDFIYIEDICQGLFKCANVENIEGDVFNISTGKATTITELAELICEISNSSSEIIKVDSRKWDNSFQRYASTEKSKKILDFNAKMQIREGLIKTIKWTKENISLIEKTIEKQKVMI